MNGIQLHSLILIILNLAMVNPSPSEDPPYMYYFDGSEEEVKYATHLRQRRASYDAAKAAQRQVGGGGRDQACEILVAIDEPMFLHYNSNLTNITGIVTDLVDRLNRIYANTIFRGEFGHLYFR